MPEGRGMGLTGHGGEGSVDFLIFLNRAFEQQPVET